MVKNYCHFSFCDKPALQMCGGCETYYCGNHHEALDLGQGGHKETCTKTVSVATAVFSTRAVEIHKATLAAYPNDALAYYGIAIQLFPNKNAFDFLIHSIGINSNFVGPLVEMALYLKIDQSIVIKGVEWTKLALYTKAIALDPDFFVPYHNLGVIALRVNGVVIGGKVWTQEELFNKAHELMRKFEEKLPPGSTNPKIEVRRFYNGKNDLNLLRDTYEIRFRSIGL